MPETNSGSKLTAEEVRRYQRHFALEEVGIAGQEVLKASSVLVVGAGGLGSPLALYLAAAGVGRLGIVDFDDVDASNLHRQVLHGSADIGRQKVASARDTLNEINPFVELEAHAYRLTRDNATRLIREFDVVADGTDNFPTRYLINDACVLTGKPNVYGSVYKFEGQVSVFAHPDGPCYRCIFPEPPPAKLVPSCADGGVMGVLPGIVGSLQANEVLKMLLRIGEPLVGRMLLFDALAGGFQMLTVPRDPACIACSGTHGMHDLPGYDSACDFRGSTVPEMTVAELHALRLARRAPFVLDVRKPYEQDLASIGPNQLIPVEELPGRLAELAASPTDLIVAHCRSGVRSARAVQILHGAGFKRAINLKGGILAWSREIDPAVPTY